MDFSAIKVLAGYLSASAAAVVATVKLACALGQDVITFSGNFFR
jgi:hypothetical protein